MSVDSVDRLAYAVLSQLVLSSYLDLPLTVRGDMPTDDRGDDLICCLRDIRKALISTLPQIDLVDLEQIIKRAQS